MSIVSIKEQQEEAVVYWSEVYDWVWVEHLVTKDTRQARIEAHESFLLELKQKKNSLMPITCFFDPAPKPPPLPTRTKKYRSYSYVASSNVRKHTTG